MELKLLLLCIIFKVQSDMILHTDVCYCNVRVGCPWRRHDRSDAERKMRSAHNFIVFSVNATICIFHNFVLLVHWETVMTWTLKYIVNSFTLPIIIQSNNILSSILVYFHLNCIQSLIKMVLTPKCLLLPCE